MPQIIVIQGRPLSDQDLLQIRRLLARHPSWHRTRLSHELCTLWGWRDAAGRLKDMAGRTLLLKLESRRLIGLPPRQPKFLEKRTKTSTLLAFGEYV